MARHGRHCLMQHLQQLDSRAIRYAANEGSSQHLVGEKLGRTFAHVVEREPNLLARHRASELVVEEFNVGWVWRQRQRAARVHVALLVGGSIQQQVDVGVALRA